MHNGFGQDMHCLLFSTNDNHLYLTEAVLKCIFIENLCLYCSVTNGYNNLLLVMLPCLISDLLSILLLFLCMPVAICEVTNFCAIRNQLPKFCVNGGLFSPLSLVFL